jgi:RNA polymerase sigma-70 factor (ECF subfamily)
MSVQRRLYGYVMSIIPNPTVADDIVQETASVLWLKFDKYEKGTDFAAWALAIARFQILNYMKKQKTYKKYFSQKTIETIENVISKTSKQEDGRIDALRSCIKKLKDDQRKLLYLRYEFGATLKSLSKRLSININTIYSRLSRIHINLLHCVMRKMAN